MTRYLTVAKEIAERVHCGALLPGVELPAVRPYAAQRGMTASTISRAYHYLADGGSSPSLIVAALASPPKARSRRHGCCTPSECFG